MCGAVDSGTPPTLTTADCALRNIAAAFGVADRAASRVWLLLDGRKLRRKDLACPLAVAGIADGAELGVTPRRRRWGRARTELVQPAADPAAPLGLRMISYV